MQVGESYKPLVNHILKPTAKMPQQTHMPHMCTEAYCDQPDKQQPATLLFQSLSMKIRVTLED